ncbi:MAG: STAS domain-containing protein [Actinomycetes bacterium]
MPLRASVNQGEGIVTVTAEGTLAPEDVCHLGDALLAAQARNHDQPIVLDLSGVRTWSLPAQAVLLSAARSARARGRPWVLAGACDTLVRSAGTLRVFERIPSYPSLGEARAALLPLSASTAGTPAGSPAAAPVAIAAGG